MKSSFCIDLQRFMLIPTKFPLSRNGHSVTRNGHSVTRNGRSVTRNGDLPCGLTILVDHSKYY